MEDKNKKSMPLRNIKIVKRALLDSFVKLNPKVQVRNPVMFVVYLGAIICTAITCREFSSFHFQITAWLWFTVLFANFAEAIAEGRGKAQADSLRSTRKDVTARLLRNGGETPVAAKDLRKNDKVVCIAGDTIPGDGEVIEGVASVDESAITGESAPVLRESGGDRSAVTGGTRVLSDRIVIRITSEVGNSFLDQMIAMVEGSKRKATPNEIALNILLISLTIVFLAASPPCAYKVPNIAGKIAKYFATSFAMLKVVRAPRVINNCLPVSTISRSLVGLLSRSTIFPASRAA